MNLRSIVAVAWVGTLAGMAMGAGDSGQGIMAGRADRTVARKAKVSTSASTSERGGATTQTDGAGGTGVPNTLPPATVVDFQGFPYMDAVNTAYAGGTSGSGVARGNLGVNFSGAVALATWNGTGSPDPAIGYASSGSTVLSSSNGAFWRGIEFHYCAAAPVTVETYSGLNGAGTLLETFSLPANVAGQPYSTWALRQLQFTSLAKSVKMTGTVDRWGFDAIKITAGCPAPTSGGDDCNGNGLSDACEIASGLVQDCNGNGKPDSCDIAPQPFAAARNGGLITWGGTVYTTFAGLPVAQGNVDMRFEVTADIDNGGGEGVEFVLFTAGGNAISVNIVGPTGPDCSTQVRNVTVPASVFNAARSAGGELMFAIRTGPDTNCCCSHVWRIDMSYGMAGAPDCNGNGVPDSCDIASGAVADCNGNGVPDSCDIAGGMADCNGNGALDSCELASGTAVDQNGNGVPDSCDPFPTLTLTANAAACNAIGSVIDVDARLSGVLNLVVAGQVVLDWDPSKLQLIETNPGDAPYVANYLIDSASGQAMILVSSSQGGTGTTAPSAIVSRLKFQVIGGSCDGSGTSVGFGTAAGGFETQFTDGFGTSIEPTLVASAGFVADDGAPVIANVPADVSVQAFAGENGYALVTLGSPTATDGCQSGVTLTGTRSDGQALTAAWPSGSTTVTWSAVDACGNASYANTTVTVDPTNTMDLSAAFGGNFVGASRSLSLTMLGGAGTQSRTRTVSIPWGGASSFSVNDLPVDDYTCATIEDPARSLKARVTVSDTGSVWSAAAATMVLGDLIDDEVIDVLDWGAYVVSNPAADLNADGFINAVDGNIILANFTRRGDGVCGSSANGPRDPILAITVADVVSMGLPELAGADLNGDGWIDQADIDLGH